MTSSLGKETTPLLAASEFQSSGTDEHSPQGKDRQLQAERLHHQRVFLVLPLLMTVVLLLCFVFSMRQSNDDLPPHAESGIRAATLLASSDRLSAFIPQHELSHRSPLMYSQIPLDDFGAYKEYSVVHSDRSLNLMSRPFQQVMQDLNQLLKVTYNAHKVAIIPGSGTYGMEAVARQFATNRHVMVLRNGYFSYRWTQIFNFPHDCHIPKSHTVLKAQPMTPQGETQHPQYAPYPIDRVVARIYQERPAAFFAPHVETSTGILLPDEYIAQLSAAMHDVGGLLVLDCIASGTIWIDMEELGVDVLISAPQKDWTSPPSSALVMLSKRAVECIDPAQETSFSLSLTQWLMVMDAYEQGGYAYHTTPPTDALREFQRVSVEMLSFGLPQLKRGLADLGQAARVLLNSRGLISVAAPGFEAPGVLVYYSPGNNTISNLVMVQCFQEHGLQIAKGVPFMIDEPKDLKTFRVGLFGLDKLIKEEQTIGILNIALDHVLADLS